MKVAKGKYHIWTVGCQMNMADSQRVSSVLDGLGWEEAPTMETANLVVLNTCSVREQPEKRAHGQLSLLAHAKKQRSDLLVAMMGCMIGNQRTIDDLKKRYPAVDLFFKVEKVDILPQFLEDRWTPLAGEGCIDFAELGAPRGIGSGAALPVQIIPRPAARLLHYPTTTAVGMKSRGPTAWLPVVLGCNKVCSYCIVPSRRGVAHPSTCTGPASAPSSPESALRRQGADGAIIPLERAAGEQLRVPHRARPPRGRPPGTRPRLAP